MKIFATIAASAFLLFHVVAYYGLIRHIFATYRAKILAGIVVILHYLIALYFANALLFRAELPNLAYIVLSLPLLSAVVFFTFGVINALVLGVLWALRKKMEARIKCARIVFVIALCCVVFAIFNAHRMPRVTQTTIFLPNLARETTLLAISDLHLSRLITLGKVERIIDLANALKPDTIVLVGDIIDSRENILAPFLPHLARLNAPNGVYFVLGNHEFIFGAENSLRIIKKLGNITPLVNSSVIIDNNFNLAGVSDLMGFRSNYLAPDLEAALREKSANLPTILLSHQPNIIKYLHESRESSGDSSDLRYDSRESSGDSSDSRHDSREYSGDSRDFSKEIDLIISGHTHGGQIFPFNIAVYFSNPYLYGLKNMGTYQMLISQGAHLAVTYGRLFSRAEINLITLKRSE